MPTISGRVATLGIGADTANVLLGSQYELAPFDGTIQVGAKADKTNVSMSLFAGPDTLQEPGGAVPVAASEATPAYPDDFHWEDEVAKGDRIKLIFHNGNAATTNINWSVRMTPA